MVGVGFIVDGLLLLGPARELGDSAVHSVSWGRIEASLETDFLPDKWQWRFAQYRCSEKIISQPTKKTGERIRGIPGGSHEAIPLIVEVQ